jgi:hypothetical protein
MTYKQIQDRVLDRLNLTSTESRARVKNFINERYRQVVTSCSLPRLRMGTAAQTTVSGAQSLTASGVIKPITLTLPSLNRVLYERSQDQLRTYDPSGQWLGAPQYYAVTNYGASNFAVLLMPKPDAAYTINVDGYLAGTDLSNDSDVPAFPEDFHDILEDGSLSDEYDHKDKDDYAKKYEVCFQVRLSELRYFIAKSIYSHRTQNSANTNAAAWYWLYGFEYK